MYSFTKCLLLSVCFFITTGLHCYAQSVGSKISFLGRDGKTYTGIIKEINNNKYRVKYDGYEFESWLFRDQFNVSEVVAYQNNSRSNQSWKLGDKVEAYSLWQDKWVNATISNVLTDRNPIQWMVSLEDRSQAIADFSAPQEKIRPRGSKPAINFSVNMRVDCWYPDGEPQGRGTIVAIGNDGRYTIQLDGCAANSKFNPVVDWMQLKPEAQISSNHADVMNVLGKWAMFVYSYPNTVVSGNYVYRVYGTGAKAPPLLINSDGTFVWYDEFNKPPVKGKWRTDSKIDGMKMGTGSINGIIIYDSYDKQWKIYKDREDHIEARQLCSGLTEGGSRIK